MGIHYSFFCSCASIHLELVIKPYYIYGSEVNPHLYAAHQRNYNHSHYSNIFLHFHILDPTHSCDHIHLQCPQE